jgi:spermidine synthase
MSLQLHVAAGLVEVLDLWRIPIQLVFDKKTDDVIVWNGQTVMSRSEEPYFEALFQTLSRHLSPKRVLEIGYGLGISAKLIQRHLRPAEHHIVEIEASIYRDLQDFAREHVGVWPIGGDWTALEPAPLGFDLVFYDPFDYSPSSPLSPEQESTRLQSQLARGGVLCHPHFGDGPTRELPGFSTEIIERLTVPPINMADGSTCSEVAIVLKRRKRRALQFKNAHCSPGVP